VIGLIDLGLLRTEFNQMMAQPVPSGTLRDTVTGARIFGLHQYVEEQYPEAVLCITSVLWSCFEVRLLNQHVQSIDAAILARDSNGG
jgi:hypothetical protein